MGGALSLRVRRAGGTAAAPRGHCPCCGVPALLVRRTAAPDSRGRGRLWRTAAAEVEVEAATEIGVRREERRAAAAADAGAGTAGGCCR
jgi:hypothetical protein